MSAALASGAMSADAQSDLLHRALAASGDSRCWVLIDQSIRPLDDDQPLAQALVEAGAEIVRMRSPHPNFDSRFMPLLARLDSEIAAGSAALRASIEEAQAECEPEALMHGAGRRIGGWVQSGASTGAALANHISRQMLHRRRDGRLTLLRWTDPAVLWAMWSAMTPPQQSRLLGPISAYHLCDPQGSCFALLPSSSHASSRLEVAPTSGELAFTNDQWQQLDAIGPLNQAFLQLGLTKPSRALLEAARDSGMAAILRARALGFADEHDLAAFAWRAMSVHPHFDRHPLVAEHIAKRQAEDLFTALVDSLAESDWSHIAAQASQPESN